MYELARQPDMQVKALLLAIQKQLLAASNNSYAGGAIHQYVNATSEKQGIILSCSLVNHEKHGSCLKIEVTGHRCIKFVYVNLEENKGEIESTQGRKYDLSLSQSNLNQDDIKLLLRHDQVTVEESVELLHNLSEDVIDMLRQVYRILLPANSI